jgi:hypothetical protein
VPTAFRNNSLHRLAVAKRMTNTHINQINRRCWQRLSKDEGVRVRRSLRSGGRWLGHRAGGIEEAGGPSSMMLFVDSRSAGADEQKMGAENIRSPDSLRCPPPLVGAYRIPIVIIPLPSVAAESRHITIIHDGPPASCIPPP